MSKSNSSCRVAVLKEPANPEREGKAEEKRALEGDGVDPSKKPVFLTKAQRGQLSLQRRQGEAAEQRRRLEEARSLAVKPFNDASASFAAATTTTTTANDSSDRHRSSRDRDRDRDRDRERDRELDRRSRDEDAKTRDRYLGSKKPKKRVIKPSEKFRFSFDWENSEDTSRDMNSLYQNPHEAQLLFGRGFRAGMDRREQKKLAAKNEKELREEIRRKERVEEKPEDAAAQRKKEAAANLYDTFDMRVDRHWSEKKLEEMTERDWRIFREDFNISYEGVADSPPYEE
ncbi:hypothetical protein EJ110_NYTH07041 [Nymphaea thermarum]|nr:hypothetical protein EJ110_NYTH07041 [Nymphaea thermarum]